MKKNLAFAICVLISCPAETLMPLASAEATKPQDDRPTLESIHVGSDQVSFTLSAPVKYNTFVTANPPRLVVEMLNTEFGNVPRVVAGRGEYLKRVRSGQFAGEPHPIARAVIDLARPVDYRVALKGSELLVLLGGGAALAAASAAPAKDDSPLVDSPAATKPAAPADDPPPSGSNSAGKETTPADAGSMSTNTSEELTAMANNDSVIPTPRDATAAAGASTVRHLTASRRMRRDILSTLPRELISLDFDNTEIGDILKLLAAKANLNIIYGPDVNGTLSLHLADVPFSEALNVVLSMRGLVAAQAGENVLRVMTPEVLSKERTNAVGVTRVFPLNYIKAVEAKKTIDAVRVAEKRSGTTVADDKNNALIVTDVPEGLAAAERLLADIDTRPRQVLIEAKLVEVSLNKDLDLGIQWDYFSVDNARHFGQTGQDTIGAAPFPATNPFGKPFDRGFAFPSVTGTGFPGANGRGTGVLLPADKIFGAFTFGRVTNNYFLSATLTAAAAQGKVKVLSDPKIATINGKQATINITTQIPYVTSSVAATGVTTQAVSYTTTGIMLSVTPTINIDGRITLQVTPNVSKPSAIAASAGTTGAVAIDSRQADTNVIVRDGETIVIGGLITDSVSNQEGKIPLLGDIPIIGWLFKKKTVIRQRVELLIFVTTRIMPD